MACGTYLALMIAKEKGGEIEMRKTMFMAVLTTMLVLYGGVALANQVSGSLWHVSEAVSQNAIPANVPLTPAAVTFDVNSPLNFSSLGTDYTIGAFLASGGAFNISENIGGTLTSLMDTTGVGTLIQFTGFVTVTTGQQFTVGHDDGLTLVIGGVNLGFNPAPTAFVSSTATYTGPSGNQPFELVYGECCGAPARLTVDLPFTSAVPEPTSMLLFGFGLLGLAGVRRFKK
jgi:hypothetical protein